MNAVTVRPFRPFRVPAAVTHAEVADIRALRRWSASAVRVEALEEVLAGLLGCKVTFEPRGVWRGNAGRALAHGVRIVLERIDTNAGAALRFVIEAEGALAVAAVTRALRRPIPRVIDESNPLSPELVGALGAIVTAALRRVDVGSAWRVLDVGSSADSLFSGDDDTFVASLTVAFEGEAFVARVAVPRALTSHAPTAPWNAAGLRALGDMTLTVPLVACASTASAVDMAALSPGDVWCPGVWPLAKGSEGWQGPVLLAPPALEYGLRATLGDEGRLVLGGEVESLAWTAAHGDNEGRGAGMEDSMKGDALIEAIGEVPVVVRVEVGAAEMRARDWAAVGRGDVIALGSRIADPVVLRVGGLAVARGELVDIEGEMGVRIVERLDQKRGSL